MPRPTRRYRGHAKPPYLWFLIAIGAWQLERADGWNLWNALVKARFSRPSELRHKVLLWKGHYEDIPLWLARACPPAEVVTVMEDLVLEQLLSRRDASAMEERLFECLTQEGAWK